MKVPVFRSSPVFPPTTLSKPSLSTNRDDHLIPLLSQDNFTFKAQQTSLYMYPTDYTFRLFDKNQDFSTSIASKTISPLKRTNLIPTFSHFHKKLLIIKHTLNFYSTPNHRVTFLSNTCDAMMHVLKDSINLK